MIERYTVKDLAELKELVKLDLDPHVYEAVIERLPCGLTSYVFYHLVKQDWCWCSIDCNNSECKDSCYYLNKNNFQDKPFTILERKRKIERIKHGLGK